MNKSNLWLMSMAVLVCIGGVLYGYDIGVISGALLFIHKAITLTPLQEGVIVGAVLLGGWFGALMAGPIADYGGRKLAIIAAALSFIAGVFFIIMSHHFMTLVLARILLGLGVGVVSVAIPLYVTELVPASHRGRYVTLFQLFLTFGIMAAYGIDLLFTPSGNWRGMFAVVLVPAALLLIGVIFLPESPRWLIANNELQQAKAVLLRMYSSDRVEQAVQMIQGSMQQRQPSFAALFSPKLLLITVMAMAIAVLNQWTGINSFLKYAPDLLKQAGVSTDSAAMLSSLGIGAVNFIVTLVALLFIDRVGRKPLLIIGTIGVCVSELFLAATGYMHLSAHMSGLLTLFGLMGFIVFFALGPGVVVWLALSELFPTQLRGRGMALCLFLNAMAGWLLATFFLDLNQWIGVSGTYLLCAGATLIYALIAVFILPETKGKTLEQVQEELVDQSASINDRALVGD